jgi:hypothetical protein
MAKKFLTPIDLNKLELRNAVIQNLGAEPASPAEGQIYYDTGNDRLRIYANGAWSDVGAITSITGTTNEIVVSASVGAITISLPDTISANISGTAASASYATSVAPDSVQLGTSTTGNYIATISGTNNEIEVSGSGSESAAVTVGLPENVTVSNDLTVGGNLTVSGSVVYLNVENLNVEDNVITLNYGTSGAPTLDAGIAVARGSSASVELLWDEGDDQWTLTNNGTNYHAIARKHAASVGDGSASAIVVTHNLGTRDVEVQIYTNSGDYETVEADVERTSTNTVTVRFAVAPTSNQYRVVVTG